MHWQVIQPREIPKLGRKMKAWRAVVVDVETTGKSPYLGDRVFGLGVGNVDADEHYYIPVRGLNCVDLRPVIEVLEHKPLLNQNIKFDLHFMAELLGWEGKQESFADLLPLARIWSKEEKPSLGLKQRAKEDLGYEYKDAKVVAKIAAGKGEELSDEDVAYYNAEDLWLTKRLYKKYKSELPDHLLRLYAKECQITRDLFDAERRGMSIDTEYLERATVRLDSELGSLIKQIEQASGLEGFNPGSNPQMCALMEQLDINPVKRTKPSKKFPMGGVSWDRDALLAVRHKHAVAMLVAKERALGYQRDGMIERCRKYVVHGHPLHGEFKNWGTITGRLSGDTQQMPDGWLQFGEEEATGDDVLVWLANEEAREREFSIRRLIEPREGYVLVKPDYKQIEMYVLGYYMKDPTFDRWLDSGNVHAAVALEIWGDAEKYYKRGKTFNFATVYGQGRAARAKALGTSIEQGDEFKKQYDQRMPGHRRLLKRVERLLERDGYITNYYGREYYLDSERAYVGVNYIVQGSSGDFVKHKLPDTRELRRQMGAHVINTTHDDLVIEVPVENVGAVPELIAACRISPFGRELELDVEYSRDNLVELHPFEELLDAA